MSDNAARASRRSAPAGSAIWTPDQRLRDIFLHLDWAEKLPEPMRTEKLRAMIGVGLRDTAHIEMPNSMICVTPTP